MGDQFRAIRIGERACRRAKGGKDGGGGGGDDGEEEERKEERKEKEVGVEKFVQTNINRQTSENANAKDRTHSKQ